MTNPTEADFRLTLATLLDRIERLEVKVGELTARQDAETDLNCLNESRCHDALKLAALAMRENEILAKQLGEVNMYKFAFNVRGN